VLPALYIESVLAKCDALRKNGLWSHPPKLRPQAWLDNFTGQDRLMAAILLDNFVFCSSRTSDRLLVAAYDRLEDDLLLRRVPIAGATPDLLERCVFTPVEGEDPRPTDSGKTLCRKLRDLVEISDDRFVDPRVALERARAGTPVVFVDDFFGSGQQLIRTWKREYGTDTARSFAEAHAAQAFPAICLALVVTDTAARNIGQAARGLHLACTHVVDTGYSLRQLAAPFLTPPLADFQSELERFVRANSERLELPSFMSGDQRPFGFHELGLLFSFEHGTPDCVAPLLWATSGGTWVRLVSPG